MQSENRGPDDGHVYVTDIHSQILGTYPASSSSCFGIVARGASAAGVAYIRLFCRVSTHRACTYISPFLCLTNKAFRKETQKTRNARDNISNFLFLFVLERKTQFRSRVVGCHLLRPQDFPTSSAAVSGCCCINDEMHLHRTKDRQMIPRRAKITCTGIMGKR